MSCMKTTFHEEALAELKDVTAYYKGIDDALGGDFRAAFKEAVEDMLEQPLGIASFSARCESVIFGVFLSVSISESWAKRFVS